MGQTRLLLEGVLIDTPIYTSIALGAILVV